MPPTKSDNRGSAAPLFLFFVALSVACCLAVARAGANVIARAHAQDVADAVALAWVMNGPDAARALAAGAHSRVVESVDDGTTVHLVVHTEDGTRVSSTVERGLASTASG